MVRPIALLWCCAALSGCGSGSGGQDGSDTQTADAGDATPESDVCTPFKIVGQPCDDPCECLGGMCVLNEYAPFRFCTRPCEAATPGTPCAPEPGAEGFTAFCVQFPSEFLVPPDTFCAPLCNAAIDCAKLGAPWETCEPPHWKGNALYPSVPDSVCMAASAQGHMPVDPDTCEGWEPLYDLFPEERLGCLGFCEYLAACQVLDPGTPKACCAFHCMGNVVVEGVVDEVTFKQQVRCFFDNFQAFQGTALACSKPEEACGKPEAP